MTAEDTPHTPPASPFPPSGSLTEHTLEIEGATLSYQATAEWVTLRRIHKPVAHVFHTAYVVSNPSPSRPLTFVFNGGPGAASAFLHMGALGPQRVAFDASGTLPEPPAQVLDNLETWLAFTDLVFIDPLGTGFSRAIREDNSTAPAGAGNTQPGGKTASEQPSENRDYWEIERDIESLGDFICRYLSKHHRWTSPLYIAGESYGGFRVAKMARKLQEEHGVGLSGALLISPAIEFDGLFGSDYNLTHWIELFPSLVATAYQHQRARLPQAAGSVEDAYQQGIQFATNELACLLAAGESLPDTKRSAILATITEMTGLSEEVVLRSGGRLDATTFCRELLREKRQLCGHYDGSVTAIDPFPNRTEYAGPDPTLFSIDRLFTAAINDQLRHRLGLQTDLDYRLLSMDVYKDWKHTTEEHVFRKVVGAMDELRYGMSLNEHMRVFISHGYFDLITPAFSSQRLVEHMKLTEAQRKQLVTKSYPGGHMFYSWDESRVAFRNDAAAFYAEADTRTKLASSQPNRTTP